MAGPRKSRDLGVPQKMTGRITPIVPMIESPPMIGNPPHLNLEQTLREMHVNIQALQVQVSKGPWDSTSSDSLEENGEFVASVAKAVSRKITLGKVLMWFVGLIGTVFSLGMAYALFIGENATDTEVENSVIIHNDGVDPDGVDENGERYGSHPKMKRATHQLQEDMGQVKVDIGEIKRAQKKSDKRGEYQFEFSRWQAKVMECERTRECKPPSKPAHLERLESDIHLGKFDDK